MATLQEKVQCWLVWCYKTRGYREQVLWRYWLSERYIKQWYYKPTGDGCLQEVWAVGAMKHWHCCIVYLGQVLFGNTSIRKIPDSHHWPQSPLKQQITVFFLYCLLAFCILSGSPIISTCSCHQDMKLSWVGRMVCHPHTGFYYSILLTYLSYGYGSLCNISGIDLRGSGYRKMSNLYPVVSVNVLS